MEDKQGYLYVQIDIKHVPEVMADLEDAYVLAEVYTSTTAAETVKILNKYTINQDVSVWARLPSSSASEIGWIIGDDEVVLLGNTWYSAQSNSYTFKRYKP